MEDKGKEKDWTTAAFSTPLPEMGEYDDLDHDGVLGVSAGNGEGPGQAGGRLDAEKPTKQGGPRTEDFVDAITEG